MLDEYLWSDEKRAKAESIRAEAERAWIDVKAIADDAAMELQRITDLPLDKHQARRARDQLRKLRRTLRTVDRLLRWPMTKSDPIMEMLMADARNAKDDDELREAHIAIATREEAMPPFGLGLTVTEWMIGLSLATAAGAIVFFLLSVLRG